VVGIEVGCRVGLSVELDTTGATVGANVELVEFPVLVEFPNVLLVVFKPGCTRVLFSVVVSKRSELNQRFRVDKPMRLFAACSVKGPICPSDSDLSLVRFEQGVRGRGARWVSAETVLQGLTTARTASKKVAAYTPRILSLKAVAILVLNCRL